MRHSFFAVILVVACTTFAAAGPIEDAESAYQREDYALAERLFRPLAEQGDAQAQFCLGVMYRNGEGVQPDTQEAVKWFRKAAEQGYFLAQSNLGMTYFGGWGVPKNEQEAMKWFRKAAEQGDSPSQAALGTMYEKGWDIWGISQDFIRAHMWYSVAAAGLSGGAEKTVMKDRDRVASRMKAAQIGKAQEMARHCQQSHFKECD